MYSNGYTAPNRRIVVLHGILFIKLEYAYLIILERVPGTIYGVYNKPGTAVTSDFTLVCMIVHGVLAYYPTVLTHYTYYDGLIYKYG